MLYTVPFEIFGKKMKTKIQATSAEDAKYKVMGAITNKIVWGEITSEIPDDTGMLNHLRDMFGMK